MITNSGGYSNHPESISIANIITNSIEEEFSKDATKESDTDTTINNRTKVPAEIVGGI